ncbi:MAG TPA: hypothetical protein PKZ36_00925 [Candidatus Paceibacterota bacterium]|nr:hypothetical protein [Candidatus Paceibacterota bacterium]HPT17957.1 hypothetical protein [Candidatus Paceibacterota bacterium]
MRRIKKRKIFIPLVMASLVTTLGVGPVSFTNTARADTSSGNISSANNSTGNRYGFGKGKGQGASGVVTAISGPMLTITGKHNVIYVVDASDATLLKSSVLTSRNGVAIPGVPVAIALSDIKVGDIVKVRGVISETSIKAVVENSKNNLAKTKIAKNEIKDKLFYVDMV